MGRRGGFVIDRWREESLTEYAGRKVPELEWSGGHFMISAIILSTTGDKRRLVLEDKRPNIGFQNYSAHVHYPRDGAWDHFQDAKIRRAVVGSLAKFGGGELWARWIVIGDAWWKTSKWKRDMRQLEQEIFAQVLGLPKPSLEAGALSLAQDTRGGLSLAQETR